MRFQFHVPILAVVALIVCSPVSRAQQSAKGKTSPDLSGVWMGRERANIFEMKKQPMMLPKAEEQFKNVKKELDPELSCFPPGVPRLLLFPTPFEIAYIPGTVLMLFERDHWVRRIYTDGRQHPKDLDPSWMGHSIGTWDGDTLVVDTVGFNDKTWIDHAGHPHSDALHLIERYRRTDPETLAVEITVEDPKTYKEPWTGQKVFKLHRDWEIMEQVNCEERLKLVPTEY